MHVLTLQCTQATLDLKRKTREMEAQLAAAVGAAEAEAKKARTRANKEVSSVGRLTAELDS